MVKCIDADALIMRLSDYALAKSPNDNDDADIRFMDKLVYEAINECIKAVEEMPAADVEPVSRWISVDERLPEYEGSYLVCTAKSGAFIGHYYARSKSFTGGRGHIAHWMDRPEPPKMDGGSEE